MSQVEAAGSTARLIFNNDDEPAITLPPPAPARGHQRSRTTTELPPLFSRTPSASPTRSSTYMPFSLRSREPSPEPRRSIQSPVADSSVAEAQRRPKPGTVGKIASWFEGSSEPVNITLLPSPKKERPDPLCHIEEAEETKLDASSGMDNLTQRPQRQSATTPSSTTSSRFSFFRRSTTTTTPVKIDPDELVHMDIREALLPDGPVEDVTPGAFKSLQLNAEGLLRKFQLSYAENLGALRQMTSEKHILADELEASQTRSEHLKLQLLDMAERASEQEKVIASLRAELSMPSHGVRMITGDDHIRASFRNRKTRTSDISASDESFVDSEMSSALSIFSEAESIRTPSTSVAPSPTMKHARLYSPIVVHSPSVKAQVTPVLVPECQNCHNVSATEAWTVIDMMKMESACLKQRITELESAHDSALDFLTAMDF